MKIVLIHPHDIFSTNEPWTVRIREIARELHKKGHEVKLCYFELPTEIRGLIDDDQIQEIETISLNRKKWALFKNIKIISKLAKWADVIHFQKCFPLASVPALIASYKEKKALHYDWDDYEYAIYQWSPPSRIQGIFLNFFEKIMPRLVDTITYSSESVKSLALNRGAKEEDLFEGHVGANIENFDPNTDKSIIRRKYNFKDDEPVIMYLGQLHGGQYARLFIEALNLLRDKGISYKALIVGGGHDFGRLRYLCEKLKLSEDLFFTGFINYKEVKYYVAAADICVACFEDNKLTRSKSPLKIVEYLASGKAIVASNVGEVPRMLEGCGIIVEPGCASALTDGIVQYLENPDLYQKNQILARKRAEEKYNWKVTSDFMEAAYKKAIAKHKK